MLQSPLLHSSCRGWGRRRGVNFLRVVHLAFVMSLLYHFRDSSTTEKYHLLRDITIKGIVILQEVNYDDLRRTSLDSPATPGTHSEGTRTRGGAQYQYGCSPLARQSARSRWTVRGEARPGPANVHRFFAGT